MCKGGLFLVIKVVPEGCCRNFFGVKVRTVKLIGGRRSLAARSGLKDGRHINCLSLLTWDCVMQIRFDKPTLQT